MADQNQPEQTPAQPQCPVDAEDKEAQALLYDTLGGAEVFTALVEKFYTKVLSDPLLEPMFVGVDMDRQRKMMHKFLAHVFGNRDYNGRSMRAAHKRLVNLTDEHFDKVAMHLKATIEEAGVDAATVADIMRTVETTRGDVLGRNDAEKAAMLKATTSNKALGKADADVKKSSGAGCCVLL